MRSRDAIKISRRASRSINLSDHCQKYCYTHDIVFVQLIYYVVKVADIARATSRNVDGKLRLNGFNVWGNKFGHKPELKVKFKNPSYQSVA